MDRIANIIRADHRELALCYRRIVDAADEDEQTRHQNQFTWELARHLVGEELVLFPAIEKNVRDDPVDEQQQQHRHDEYHPHQKVSRFGLVSFFLFLTSAHNCRSKKISKSSKISTAPTHASSPPSPF